MERDIQEILISEEQLKAEHDAEKPVYSPVSIFCPECHTDFTTITSLSDDCTVAEYTCRCGHHGTFNFTENFNCKLGWKIDWPMRWRHEGVDFEPGGKDHSAPTGSYNNSKVIAKKIYNHEAPIYQGYEFIGIKGPSGSGKSTVLKLITGLYPVDGGNFTIETKDKEYDCKQIKNLFSFVPQGNMLFSGTVKENLTILNPNATEDDIKNALSIKADIVINTKILIVREITVVLYLLLLLLKFL